MAIVGILFFVMAVPARSTETATATFVGGKECVSCHEEQARLWRGSHHALAMQPADAETVRGNFNRATFVKDSVTSTFSHRGADYNVRTDGADGKPHDYRVAYTFGVSPLQQYLIGFPDGRYQALGIAWDTRPAGEGGQRWFHLYPNEHVPHDDVLHWTGPAQNWNYMCADCHSTNLKKNYHPRGERFDTTWSDVDVSCEACHGPGSRHVEWARRAKRGAAEADPFRGFAFQLGDASGGAWAFAPDAPIAHRTKPPSSRAEVETCGRCHARRAQIWSDYQFGQPLAQTYRVALLDPELYHADGQIKDEVYEYGSFLQSRMYQAGVTCSDCHDPHSGRLRAEGNAVCGRCHQPDHYDRPEHHHHPNGTVAARCVSCHMIERTYMVVDGRRDHSFRVPRPDLSARLRTPNACNDCHTDKTPQWAADAVAQWYGPNRVGGWHYGEALYAGRTWRLDAETQLMRVIDDPSVPAIARATAVSLLARYLTPRSLPALRRALGDGDPLVRRAAAEAVAALDPAIGVPLAAPLLRDPVRTVRLEALASLLDAPPSAFSSEQRRAVDDEIAEYRAVQDYNADRAEANANLGMLEARLGNPGAAQAAFSTAMKLQPSFVPAYVQLADLFRSLGKEAEAEETLRRALRLAPDAANAHEALGLTLVRQKRLPEAMAELATAEQLGPDVPRFAYVYAVALHDTGEPQRALAVLRRAHDRAPADRTIVAALADYERAAGNETAAREWAAVLEQLTGAPAARPGSQ